MEGGEEEGEGEGEEALSHPAALQAKIEDFRAFAERVLSAFYASRRPMKSATHFELNALARAAFVLGKNTLGFKVFRIMKDKFMTPDLHDVNVALSAVAKHNPADGALMLERMHKNRLQPDAVSFGTVIHWAIIHGDVPLVSSLMRKAREAGVTALSFKTMGSLLRATITMDTEGQAGDRSSLDNAQDLIHSLLDAGLVPTTNMGRDCVVAALRADDPVMAFRFWRLLIKDKVEWADAAQAKTRALIALKIRQHCTRDWLDHDKGRVMLSELGTDTAFDLRLRRAAAKTAPGGKAAPKEGV
ncbi:hypothetical protein A0H81_11064 [Grifola frondosa]|uniref:Uncharacterized protein n=1 Tax=Grifola frondosa TaxID=5627 RepID=A0A1C7LVX4_GRIFR|nr:hypothetical protein A0H81_11064 [Grifola frondosa]